MNMSKGLLSQAIQDETSGVQKMDQGQQDVYNVFVKAAYLIAKKTEAGIADRLKMGDPLDALAQVTVSIIEEAEQKLSEMGVMIDDTIIREGGLELMYLIYSDHGMEFTEEEAKMAYAKGVDLYLNHREEAGTLDTAGMAEMAGMIKNGTLPSQEEQEMQS